MAVKNYQGKKSRVHPIFHVSGGAGPATSLSFKVKFKGKGATRQFKVKVEV